MYTKCPECQTAFRLTVNVLRQAHGRVRCGGCAHVFDALDFLHEGTDEDAPLGNDETSAGERFERRSRELLQTLEELAGPDDVRIEDTGVEWRVFDIEDESDDDLDALAPANDTEPSSGYAGDADKSEDTGSLRWYIEEPGSETPPDDDATEPPAAHSAADGIADTPADLDFDLDLSADDDLQSTFELGSDRDAADDIRYDDNTPLPDDEAAADDASAGEPRRRAEDQQPAPLDNELQEDLALGDPDDWQALLEEVGAEDIDEGGENEAADGSSDAANAPPATTADDHEELTLSDHDRDTVAPHAADVPEAPASAGELDSPAALAEAELDAALADADEDAADELSINRQVDEDLPPTAAEPDAKPAADEARPFDSASGLFETIVMEGETVRSTLADDDDAEREARQVEPFVLDPIAVNDTEDAEPRRPAWAGIAAAPAAIVLALLLAAQLVHANRESLATFGAVQHTLGPLYRALGRPLTPRWNVRGWQFEATNGSTDASGERLTIHSRIANRSEQALPYPLVHVSLTDRREEVIGSRVLTADEYLAGNVDPERPLEPGQNFTAVIAIDAPSDAATGFKLNVCYRIASGHLRCAIDDFKN